MIENLEKKCEESKMKMEKLKIDLEKTNKEKLLYIIKLKYIKKEILKESNKI